VTSEPVVGHDAVTRRPHVREIGRPVVVHDDGATSAGDRAGADQQVGVGSYADHNEDEVDVPGQRVIIGADCFDAQVAGARFGGLVRTAGGDASDGGVGVDRNAVSGQFGVDERSELGIDGRQDFGKHLDLGDLDAAGGQALGHL
jgi:hypothetical protein